MPHKSRNTTTTAEMAERRITITTGDTAAAENADTEEDYDTAEEEGDAVREKAADVLDAVAAAVSHPPV